MALHNETGALGEAVAVRWLTARGYQVLDRNYRRRYGEIDIVARETSGTIHFVEVKCVSYETQAALESLLSRETFRVEDRITKAKKERLRRVIESWLLEYPSSDLYQVDLCIVRIVPREKYARVEIITHIDLF
jgi:putative endonuclease